MTNWHYSRNGERQGPTSIDGLQRLYRQGVVNEETLIWNGEKSAGWLPYREVSELQIGDTPPPLPVTAISDAWVWLMATVPLAGLFAETWLSQVQNIELEPSVVLLCYFAVNCGLVALDRRTVAKSGRQAPPALWALLIPVYVYKRNKRLGKPLFPFAAWLASLALSVFLAGN